MVNVSLHTVSGKREEDPCLPTYGLTFLYGSLYSSSFAFVSVSLSTRIYLQASILIHEVLHA